MQFQNRQWESKLIKCMSLPLSEDVPESGINGVSWNIYAILHWLQAASIEEEQHPWEAENEMEGAGRFGVGWGGRYSKEDSTS